MVGCSQTCHKQYEKAAELEVHLSSYDHHHKKVLLKNFAITEVRALIRTLGVTQS